MTNSSESIKATTAKIIFSRYLVFLVIACFWLAADQYSKWYATTHWKDAATQIYLNGIFRIEYALNTGGFLSLGGTLSPAARYAIFIVMNGILIFGATLYMFYNPFLAARYYWSISLIVAGGIGNLIDRIRFDGKVVDFMILYLGGYHTGIFNVADVAITTGVIAIFIFTLFDKQESPSPQNATPNLPASQESSTQI